MLPNNKLLADIRVAVYVVERSGAMSSHRMDIQRYVAVLGIP